MGKNSRFLGFQAPQRPSTLPQGFKSCFGLFLPVIQASGPMDMCASSSLIHSDWRLIGV